MINKDYIFFESLNFSHVREMNKWGRHKDPLFLDYNFVFNNDEEAKEFLLQKTLLPINKYYGILYCEELIGFIGTKNINPIRKSSTLGYVLNPAIINMGFGTLALEKFLEFYFFEKKMKSMDLLVSGYNHRARRVYEKLGFKEEKRILEPYQNIGRINIDDEIYDKIRDEFVRKDKILYNYVYKMKLRKEDYKVEI